MGGPESPRWIAVLQALLSGWILYVAAAGMVVEAILLPTLNRVPDAIVGSVAICLYLFSLVCVVPIFITGRMLGGPILFHCAVLLLGGWTALRWWQLSRECRIGGGL